MIANTQYFREAALYFQKHKVYTHAPDGSREYVQYWDREDRRCKEGYSVAGVPITGKHYFYLNYCPMNMLPREGASKKEIRAIDAIQAKGINFPGFWEIDYDWWHCKDIGYYGAYKEDVAKLGLQALPVKDYLRGHHIACLKTRRAGFSYKEAADGVWNYNFIPNSKSYYFASIEQYLTTDGILNKVQLILDHLNQHTDWAKHRMRHNTLMHQRSSVIIKKEELGYKSEIIGVIIDDPNKVRGKDGIKITYEEAGSFKNLKMALAISVPSVRSGTHLTGQISVFGTGGEEGEDIEGLTEIFEDPENYEMLAFNNIWDVDLADTKVGFFVPCYMANEDFMDEVSAKVDVEGALAYDELMREQEARKKDPNALDKRVAEYPRTPAEALQRATSNDFPVVELNKHIRYVEKSPEIQVMLRHGWLTDGERGQQFEMIARPKPILRYPHTREDDLEGCITVVEDPQLDLDDQVIPNSYFIVVDSYARDEAEDETSLGACYVYKRQNKWDMHGDKLVAWYVARPKLLHTFHRNVFRLADWYDCTIQAEIGGASGGQAIVDYARENKRQQRLEFEPLMQYNKEMARSEKNRKFLMSMSGPVKSIGINYLVDWVFKERGINENGKVLYNFHAIYDVGLLREMAKFNRYKGNFDRISALILMTFMIKEKEYYEQEQTRARSDFFSRRFFTDSYVTDLTIPSEELKDFM